MTSPSKTELQNEIRIAQIDDFALASTLEACLYDVCPDDLAVILDKVEEDLDYDDLLILLMSFGYYYGED